MLEGLWHSKMVIDFVVALVDKVDKLFIFNYVGNLGRSIPHWHSDGGRMSATRALREAFLGAEPLVGSPAGGGTAHKALNDK